jgi:AcrR family transcriptional regulator
MPFTRFDKLTQERRERVLDVAAQEFADYGYEDASINRILEKANMSKGAAYYYFEDKADLFATTVQYCVQRLELIDRELDTTTLTAESFWLIFSELHRRPLLRSFDQPWLFGAIRAAGKLSPAALERKPLATLASQINMWAMNIIKRGQQLGMIRTDLPDELIFGWLEALNDASDRWLLVHWQELDRATIARYSDQTVEAMKRALSP